LGVTPADTEALLALSRGLTTMVDFEFVESAPFQRFRKLVKARGAVELSVEWRLETYAAKMRLESWKTRATEGGGALHTFGSHIFYNLEWCLGRMDSLTAKTFKRPDDPRDTHTGVEFTAGFVSGSRAQVFLDTAASAESVHTWRFDQVELANRSKDYLGGFTVSQGGKVTFETPPSPEDGRIAAVASLVGRFVDGILGKGPSEPSFAAGHRVQVLIDKAFQSEGRLVRV
ncbi:MAG: hypothetical protein HYR96_15165, partial [Deltaproteobacteria bacterium]|nr:hypothetical protein [Deltaproteobacteria bacterium]